MFPSSSNGINSSTPFFPHITSPISKYEHLQLEPSFFNPCYSSCFHNEISEHQENPVADFAGNTGKNQILTSKRCAKRDRHSKIDTAQGPRDRRMRLPLKVAREFFDLQDQLSFDKASKTIEWLLTQASSAIEQIPRASTVNRAASSTSECQVVTEIDEGDETAAFRKGKKAKPSMGSGGKELRAKARAKARERTTEKQQRQAAPAQSLHFNPEAPATSAGESISGESWTAIGQWSPFPDLSHLYNLGFPQEENEIADFEFCKPMWE